MTLRLFSRYQIAFTFAVKGNTVQVNLVNDFLNFFQL